MKMMSSTSMTSTIGTTLISDNDVATRRPRPDRGEGEASWPALTLGTSGEIPLGDVQELHREVVHLRREQLHALGQHVVVEHRRDRREQAARGGDQRVGDRTRDHA